MPALSTRGGALSRVPRYPDKITGVNVTGVCFFNHGATSTAYRTKTREKFSFVTASVTTNTSMNMVNICANQSAAGNASVGIVATGFNGQNTPAKEKFIFSSETSVSTMSFSNYNTYSASTGNASQSITHLGWTTTYSSIKNTHTYANDVNEVTSMASVASYAGCGLGVSAYGLLCLGGTSAGASTLIDKYTYATKATASYSVLSAANTGGTAGGNQIQGIVAHGNLRTTSLITYATGSVISSALLPLKTIYGSTGCSDTMAIMTTGGTDVTNATSKKYAFLHSTKSFIASTSSLVSTWGGSALSTALTGINV